MEPSEVRNQLRKEGLVVHHVVRRKGRDDQLVVFLEGGGQHEVAASHARGLPGVAEVEFSEETNAIMYLTLGP